MRTWASVRVVEDLGVAALVAERAGEGFHGAVLPGTAGCDAECRDAQPAEPGPHRGRRERGAVVRAPGAGGPCRTKSAVRRARTSSDRRRRATAMRRHSRVCSSTLVRTRSGRPSCVRSRTQSSDQTGCGRSARRRVQAPSVAQRRRRGLRGTRRPSWRQRRSTRLWFTRQPSARSRAVMRREPERPNRRACVMSRAIQARCIRGHPGRAPRRAARLGEPPTGPTRRDWHDGSHVHDRLPPARRAQKFPADTSCTMALSRAGSATSRLNRAFSRSRSLRRFA